MQYFIAIFVVFRPRPSGPAYLAAGPFITASHPRLSFFVTKKGNEKSPAVARQRTPPQGLLAPENPKVVVEEPKS